MNSRPLQTAAVVGAISLALLLGWLYFGRKSPPQVSNSSGRVLPTNTTPTPPVSMSPESPTSEAVRPAVEGNVISVGAKGNFGTIKEALRYIESHPQTLSYEVRMDGGMHLVESITIDNSGLGTFPRGVKISGPADDPPRLQTTGSGPVLMLNSVDGLKLENLIIDCQGLGQGIRLEGFMSGVSLNGIIFENIQQSALAGIGLAGVKDRPVIIENCRFQAISGSAQAITLLPGRGQDSRDLVIRHCNFIGPLQCAISIDGSADSLSFHQNVFHRSTTGIRFLGTDPVQKALVFTNNTFHQCQQGIEFVQGPSDSATGFIFQKNLFVGGTGPAIQTSAPLDIEKLTPPDRRPRWNWTDLSAEKSGNASIFAADGRTDAKVSFLSTDPAEKNFLKPDSPELKSAGQSAEAPQQIGAVAP